MTTTTTPQTIAAKLSHRIYRVIGTGKSSKWTEIGAARSDGESFSNTCNAVPLTGRIVMREVVQRPPRATDQR